MKHGKIHVLGIALSRALDEESVVNCMEVLYVEIRKLYLATKSISSLHGLSKHCIIAGQKMEKSAELEKLITTFGTEPE